MDQWLEIIAEIIKNNIWLAPVLCLAAGVITSLTPCSLSTIPSVLAYAGAASGGNTRKAFRLSLTMALGMAAAFAVFGSFASVLGHILHEAGRWWSILLGILMILMALQIWGIIHIIPHSHKERELSGKGYAGALIVGVFNGVLASHCATPVMIAILAIVAKSGGSTLWGIFLMALYALGHSILLLAAGTGYSAVEQWINNPRYAQMGKWLRGFMGLIILVIGILMFFVNE